LEKRNGSMNDRKVLVVDDEEDILELISFNLSREGFQVTCAATGEEALKKAPALLPDIMLLDIMLPGIDGLEVARRLKADRSTQRIPIVMLTAKGEESDIVKGLELGAEDYITKPFSPKVVNARLRAVLRRVANGKEVKPEDSVISFRDLTIHPGRHEVLVNNKPVKLTFTEFSILMFLARRPGWVLTRAQLIDAVRGKDYAVTDRSIDVQIVGLRRSLGTAGKYIETVRGVGYRLKE
jgi:two-component system phosphate regulon response regulator PhoB